MKLNAQNFMGKSNEIFARSLPWIKEFVESHSIFTKPLSDFTLNKLSDKIELTIKDYLKRISNGEDTDEELDIFYKQNNAIAINFVCISQILNAYYHIQNFGYKVTDKKQSRS